jgi:hypothetical protein
MRSGKTTHPSAAAVRKLALRRWMLVLTISLSTIITAEASDPSTLEDDRVFPPWDRGAVSFGGYLIALNSSVSFGVNKVPGLTINAEDLLGLNSSLFVMGGSGYYRIGDSKRNQISFSYSGYNRSATTVLTEGIDIDGHPIAPGTEINSFLNFSIIQLSYSYAIVQDERVRIAVGLGAYIAPIKYGISVVQADTSTSVARNQLTVPLPAIGIGGEVRILPKLSLIGQLDAMYLQINGFQGSLLNSVLGLEYRPWRHFGLGLEFSAMAIRVQSSSISTGYPGTDFVGKVEMNYGGLLMYGKVAF